MFAIRRMTPADKPAVMDFASRIWEGGDYLPAVFDEWVIDETGEFAAVLLGGRVVGCGKLTFLTPTDAWLEGLRKDPRVQEKGVAETVTSHFLSVLSSRQDLTSIRFSTYVRNLASIAANEKAGFRRRIALSCKAWAGKKEELEAVRLAGAGRSGGAAPLGEERAVLDFVEASGCFAATGGLVVEGWRAYPYSRELFAARYVRRGLCRGVAAAGALRGVSVFVHDRRHGHTYITPVFLDAADEETADILFDDLFAYAKAHATGYNEIEWMVPPIERVRARCAARGFRSWEQEDDYLVYELPLRGERTS